MHIYTHVYIHADFEFTCVGYQVETFCLFFYMSDSSQSTELPWCMAQLVEQPPRKPKIVGLPTQGSGFLSKI